MKKKIIFIAPSTSTFIRDDITALENYYRVQVNIYDWRTKIKTPMNILRQLFFLFRHISSSSAIIVSFAGYWSFLPALMGKLLNKSVFIILHGTDAVSFPELNYGNLRKVHLRFIIKKSCQWADQLLPVSDALISYKNTYYSDEPILYGIKHNLENVVTPAMTVHNGLDSNKWYKIQGVEKEGNTFLSVLSHGQLAVKGVDMILDIADAFPDCKFYLAGIENTEGRPIRPNVHCLGFLTGSELHELYSRAQFYLQLSSFEGFGMALCEAMLCECIPIGSRVNEIPNIIGDTGYILDSRSSEKLKDLLNQILKSGYSVEQGLKARERIKKNYPLTKRIKKIRTIIENKHKVSE